MNEIIGKYIKKLRSPKLLMLLGLTGIALIALSSFTGDSSEKKKTSQNEFDTEVYCQSLEEDIRQLVTDISGDKKATVVVTLESGIRYSYADTREEISSDKTESEAKSSDSELKEGYILVKTADGGEQALLITANLPEIRGVAIVCEGGDSEYLNEKIQNTVTSALNISSKRVYICGRNKQ